MNPHQSWLWLPLSLIIEGRHSCVQSCLNSCHTDEGSLCFLTSLSQNANQKMSKLTADFNYVKNLGFIPYKWIHCSLYWLTFSHKYAHFSQKWKPSCKSRQCVKRTWFQKTLGSHPSSFWSQPCELGAVLQSCQVSVFHHNIRSNI